MPRFSRAPSNDWRTLLAAVCVAQATAIVGFDFTLPFIPLYLQHDLGVHGLGHVALWAGLIGFGPAIPATIFGPFWGRVADRFGYRAMLLRATFSAAALLALMSLVSSPWMLLVLRMMQGALTGTVFSSQALVAAAAPERETGRAMGLLQMSIFVGATFGPLGGGTAAALFGFRAAYVAAGCLIALSSLVVLFFVREPERKPARVEDEGRSTLGSVLVVPAFLAALVLTLTIQLAGTALLPVVPLFVQELIHDAGSVSTDTGWLLALSGLTAGAGSYVAGRLQRHLPLNVLLPVCILLSAALLVPQAFAGSYVSLVVLRCLGTVAFGGTVALVGTLAAISSPPNAKGTAFGLVGAASSMGFGSGPLLGGAVVAAVGVRPVFLFSAALLALLPPAFLVVRGARSTVWRARPARLVSEQE